MDQQPIVGSPNPNDDVTHPPDPARVVVPLHERRRSFHRPPPMSDEEIIEYRRLRPLLQRLEREYPLIVSHCPMARRLVSTD